MIYSNFKGSSLTPQDIDNNFHEIIKRLETLEGMDQPQWSLKEIIAEGPKLIFKGSDNGILGSATLPVLMPQFRGSYKENTDYFYQDWVMYHHQLYVCHTPHKSQEFNGAHWQSLDTV